MTARLNWRYYLSPARAATNTIQYDISGEKCTLRSERCVNFRVARG